MSEIYIISGFLGSGKTTLINQLLKGNREKILIVENEVGSKPIDGEILRREDVEVENLLSGCICCTMAVDFQRVVEKNQIFDKIIIEPSGVAQLSQVMKAFQGKHNLHSLTVVEAEEFLESLDFFGAFFQDQIENARTLILNIREERDYRSEQEKLRELNEFAKILVYNLTKAGPSFQDIEVCQEAQRIVTENVPGEPGMETKTIDNPEYESREQLQASIGETLSGARVFRVKGYAIIAGVLTKTDFAAGKWHYDEVIGQELGLVVIYQDF